MQPIFHLLPDAPKPVAPYSHAVEAGSFVFVTGQLATDPDDDALPVPPGIEAQTHKVMDNLAPRAQGLRAVASPTSCHVRIFLTDFKRDYATMNDIYATYFAGRPAAGPHHGRRHRAGPRRRRRDRHDRQETVRDTMVGRTKAEISAANRRRYEELRAAGQEATPKALPPATALDGAPIAPQAVISREEVPPGWYDTVRLRRGEALQDRRYERRVQRVAWSAGASTIGRSASTAPTRPRSSGAPRCPRAASSCPTWDGSFCR